MRPQHAEQRTVVAFLIFKQEEMADEAIDFLNNNRYRAIGPDVLTVRCIRFKGSLVMKSVVHSI